MSLLNNFFLSQEKQLFLVYYFGFMTHLKVSLRWVDMILRDIHRKVLDRCVIQLNLLPVYCFINFFLFNFLNFLNFTSYQLTYSFFKFILVYYLFASQIIIFHEIIYLLTFLFHIFRCFLLYFHSLDSPYYLVHWYCSSRHGAF